MTRFPTLFVVQICPINHSDTNFYIDTLKLITLRENKT